MRNLYFCLQILMLGCIAVLSACNQALKEPPTQQEEAEASNPIEIVIRASDFVASEGVANNLVEPNGWMAYEVEVPVTGRYRFEVQATANGDTEPVIWLEDYYDNPDGRTYNVTSDIPVSTGESLAYYGKEGSPLKAGTHNMKLHVRSGKAKISQLTFTLLFENQKTPEVLTQQTEGTDWKLKWSDEFDGTGLPDQEKWTYDIGNWGWGNNEPQYYMAERLENSRIEGGNLIIEAHKNDAGYPWTSARLTTRGKVSFLYGKIEFRAKVPTGDGTWAAGWLLGDAYEDELSWPYCGEIDVLECVGNEIDDETGNGINHASCHTRAYYFKQNNHITSVIDVANMNEEFHTYAIEWLPTGVQAFLDGDPYYLYDKTDGDLEWPFSKPQNLLINLAMGGGMGGEIDPDIESHQLIVDYIRVYELQ